MRVKLEHADTEDRVPRHPECIRNLFHDIHAFTATANHAVVSLYAISQICWSNFGSRDIQCDLAGKLMAIVSALSSLHKIVDATPELSVLSASDIEILTQNINKCEPIVHRIGAAVQKLDEYLAAQPEKNTRIQPPGLYNAFIPGEEKEPTSLLSECFLAIMHAIVTAKAELLSGTNHLTSSEMSEAFRLKQALPNSDLQALVKRSIAFTCSQSTRQGTNTPSTESSTLFHTQLPAPQQPAQHQPAEAYFPPQNLCDFKPWLKSAENSSKPPPSTIASNTMAFGSADNGGPSATPAIWNTLGSQTQQHLEAYILRTTVKSPQNSSITWYYDVDFLPLDNDAMVAHIRNLGSGYSIIKAIGELSPEQLRFVQECTKARDSQLVSVQFGVAADVVTSMGTFKVKPVIFVVKTAAAPAGLKSVFNKASFQNPSVPAAGSLFDVSAKATSLGLFGTNTNLLSTSKSSTSSTGSSISQPLDGQNGLFKASRAQKPAPLSTVVDADEASVPKSIFTAPNLFDTCMPAAQSGSFGANTIKPHPGFMALINSHSKSRTSRLDRAPCQDYADGLCTYE